MKYNHIFALNIVVETDKRAEDVNDRDIYMAVQKSLFIRLKDSPPAHGLRHTVYLKDTMELEDD